MYMSKKLYIAVGFFIKSILEKNRFLKKEFSKKIVFGNKNKFVQSLIPPGSPWVPPKKFSPFGSAVLAALANI